jgi:two-component system cell cycle sensor histidine kinase/response regulator CckA
MAGSMKTQEELQTELERSHARLAELEGTLADQERLVTALRESEERFELAVRGTSDGLWDWHIATGDVWWSCRYRELIGYEEDELPANYESWESLVHPDDRDRTLKAVRAHFEEGQGYDIEYRMRTKRDGYRWFLARAVAARDETEKAARMAGSIRDINEQKLAEEALRESKERVQDSEARLRAAIESLPFEFFLIDETGRYAVQNTVCIQNWGDLVGKRPEDVEADERTLASWQENNRRALAGEVVAGDLEQGRKGEARHIHNIISPIRHGDEIRGILGVNIDITERKRAEASLRETTSRLSRAQRVARMGFLDWNLRTNEIFWSDEVFRLYGINPQEVTPTLELTMRYVHPDDLEVVEKSLDAATRGGFTYDIDHRILRPDGQVLWVHAQADFTRDADGNPENLLGTIVDITDRKHVEVEKDTLATQLRHAQKMQAVGQLAGGVAHDFNNVLTTILGNTERLLARMERGSDESSTELVKGGLEEIKLATQRAAALTRQLLAFSRKEMTRAEVLDLDGVIRGEDAMLRRLLREDIVFDLRVALDTRRIRADEAQIQQVIMNLVLNARDAMPEGGTLTLACANVDLDEAYAAAHVGAKPGPHAMLAVSDTGVGMSEETMEHMFEPFFTTKPAGKGTGLGLATVFGIARQSGAHISVESELGKGSTFTVYFPAVDEEATKSGKVGAVEESGGDEVILVCEDEELVRRGACKDLRAAGYTVLEAENGKHALDVAAGYGEKIDLLVSDVIMPEMNGKRLAEELTRSRPRLRVLFVSGYADDVLDGEVAHGEGSDFLQKPFSPNDLLGRVRNLLDQP